MNPRFQRAAHLYDLGKHDAALEELHRALADEPDNARVHGLLALCLSRRGRVQAADQEISEALQRAPEDAYLHYLRSQVLVLTNRLTAAEPAIREALRLDPEESAYHGYRAAVLFDLGRPQEALAAAEGGLAVHPLDLFCLNLRSMSLLALRRTEEADAATQRALGVDPESGLSHRLRGQALLEGGRLAEALPHYQEACRIDPTSADARQGLIRCLKARVPILGWALQLAWRFLRLPKWILGVGVLVGLGVAVFTPPMERWPDRVGPAIGLLVIGIGYFWLLQKVVSWTFDFLLQCDPVARRLVPRRRKVAANLFVSLAVLGLVVVIGGVTGRSEVVGGAFFIASMLPPVFSVFRCHAGWRRTFMVVVACWMPVSVLGVFLLEALGHDRLVGIGFGLYGLGLMASIPICIWLPGRSEEG